MKKLFYSLGRSLQAAGLIALPSSIWLSEFRRSEKEAVTVLGLSVAVFAAGYFLSRIALKS